MADVDMADAPTAPAKTKTSKAAAEGSTDGKKKFEVKKVGMVQRTPWGPWR